jgi:hypothetical protein
LELGWDENQSEKVKGDIKAQASAGVKTFKGVARRTVPGLERKRRGSQRDESEFSPPEIEQPLFAQCWKQC